MKRLSVAGVTAVVLVVGLVVFAAGPIAILVSRGLNHAVLVSELTSPGAIAAIFATIRISVLATFVALALGVPLAFLFERTDLPFRRAFALCFTSLVALPNFILGMGWIQLANPSTGYLNRFSDTPWCDIYGAGGTALVLGTSGLPLVLFAVQAALARIDTSLEEAARMSGASQLRAIMDATLPLVMPSLVSGALLVFMFAAAGFGVPYLLGVATASPTHVLTTRIYIHLLKGGDEGLARACTLSAVLLALASIILVASALVSRRGRVKLNAGKGIVVQRIGLGRYRGLALVLVTCVTIAVVILPLIAVVITSLLGNASLPLAFENLTLHHWHDVIVNKRTFAAALRSVWLAGLSGIVVCILGTAIGLARSRTSGRIAEMLALWPYAVPGTVLAMALLVVYAMDIRFIVAERVAFVLALANSVSLVLVAYVAKYLAIGSRNVVESVSQLDPTLAEAARLCGATPARAFLDVVLPRLKAPLVATFVLTFLLCVTELTMSVLIAPPGKELLGTLLFDLQSYADPASASVLACAVVLVVIVGLSMSSIRSRA
jgi:iron(III) transport system permease protein